MKLHDSRQLGPLVFRDPLLLCSALYFLLYFDASGFLRLGLLAAFLHECESDSERVQQSEQLF